MSGLFSTVTSASGLRGKVVHVQRKRSDGTWSTLASPTTGSAGAFAATFGGRSGAPYRLLFTGGTVLIGSTSVTGHL